MKLGPTLSRRQAARMAAAAGLGVATALSASLSALPGFCSGQTVPRPSGAGRLKQAVRRWAAFSKIPLDEFARALVDMGIQGVELASPEDWPALRKHGLICTMTPGGGSIADGLNRKENHDRIEDEFKQNLARAAAGGVPNVITFSGNRRGLSDQEGLENCVIGLNRIKGLAEKLQLTVCLELLNSKVNHKDYQCDHTAWGVEVIRRVNSPNVKLLYDIYHMQIMEGDIIRTIRDNIQWIGHFHTAGVPGRHELDDTQELSYTPIARAIADLGFRGYLAHEFQPVRDPMTTLREAVRICDV